MPYPFNGYTPRMAVLSGSWSNYELMMLFGFKNDAEIEAYRNMDSEPEPVRQDNTRVDQQNNLPDPPRKRPEIDHLKSVPDHSAPPPDLDINTGGSHIRS